MQNYPHTDQIIHQLSQIIAKANRTFKEPKDDDSHTNLYFEPFSRRIYGRWLAVESGKIILALNLQSFCFEWLNDSFQVLQSQAIAGMTTQEIEKNIASRLSELGLDQNGFTDELHFEIPDYAFAKDKFETLTPEALRRWESYRSLANVACFHVLETLQVSNEIRIWPHHFDTGIYVEPNSKMGFGVGLAMEDTMVGSPYFYFSTYGLNGHDINYENLCDLHVGKWIITENWKGAVLPLTEVKPADIDNVNTFLQEVLAHHLKG